MIKIIEGDITKLKADIIVNAANEMLSHGGGVARAIANAAGERLIEESKEIIKEKLKLDVGEAVYTTAGNLKARYVIHTVGPIWRGGGNEERQLLEKAYQNSLMLAVSRDLRTISFPSISTGAYRYQKEMASRVALVDSSTKYTFISRLCETRPTISSKCSIS